MSAAQPADLLGARVVTDVGAPRYPVTAQKRTHELLAVATLTPAGAVLEPAGEGVRSVVPEIGFVLRRAPEGPPTSAALLAVTEAVVGVLVASDAGEGRHVVLGPRVAAVDEVGDLRLLGCVLRNRGEVVATAAGAAASGHPAEAVAWLAAELAANGILIEAGWVLCSGALTIPTELAAGQAVTVEFDHLGAIDIACA
jgi:2-keto-4-pentenoate hydratase